MKRIIGQKVFEMLLSEKTTEATNSLIQEIIQLSEIDTNPAFLFRTLHHTKYHLQIIKADNNLTVEMGKKCIRTALCY